MSGIRKFTCASPTKAGVIPENWTVAGCPPRETLVASFSRESGESYAAVPVQIALSSGQDPIR